MTHNNNPIFRAEKTTQNKDDFKVLMVGLMFGIIMLLVFPIVGKMNDQFIRDRPFIRATIEIIQTNDYEFPMILYDADSTLDSVPATWIATIHDVRGTRLATRRGMGNYSGTEDNPRLWTWEAFFDASDGVNPPSIPQKTFKICVRYVAVTVTTNVVDDSPKYCSLFFNPELGPVEIIRRH